MDDNKTEQPTEKKLRDSRNQGQVAQSQDLNSLSVILSLLIFFASAYIFYSHGLVNMYELIFNILKENNLTKPILVQSTESFLFTQLIKLSMPILLAGCVGFTVNILQIGGVVFAKDKVFKLNFEAFDVATNLKNQFSKKNLGKFIKNLVEIIIMVITAGLIVLDNITSILLSISLALSDMLWLIAIVFFKIILVMCLIYALFTIIDWYLEKRAMQKQLMMSKDEQKQEYKNTEGNPEVKSELKQLRRELADDDGAMPSMKEASMVIANPTHIAIVLLFKPTKWPLPIILLKTQGHDAQIVFNNAKIHNVPIIRDKWLARKLFKLGDVGKYIPSSLSLHLADVIGKNINLLPNLIADIKKMKDAVSPI